MSDTTPNPAGRRGLILALAGLMLILAIPETGFRVLLFPGDGLGARLGRQIVWIGFGTVVLMWVAKIERLPLASIGLRRPTGRTLGWGLAFALALIASFMLCYAIILPILGLKPDYAGTSKILANPLWLQLLIFAAAGFVEEIVYRGYLIERIEWLVSNKWLAFVASVVAFTFTHIGSWASSQLIVVAAGAVIMGLAYLLKRDLVMVMIAHILSDAVGFGLAALQS
jgi:uncharacterized protein